MKLQQVATIDVGRNGGESLYFYDVDGDGQKEMLFRQSAGLLAQEEYRAGEGLDQENFDLLCYTCFRQDGTILWQHGKPWTQDRPYRNHGEIALTVIEDINNDGKPELLYKYHDRLILRDISNGELIREIVLPNDDGWKVVLQNNGEESPNIIILGEHQMLAYSSDFAPLWEKKGEAEFSAFSFVDVDGDGKDELFVGNSMYDHDGELIWEWGQYRHIDYVKVWDVNQDGVYEVMYCECHGDFVAFDVEKRELFRDTSFIHPQVFRIGKFMPEVPGYQIFVMNKASLGGSVMLDCNGKKLWEYPCNGYCELVPGDDNNPDMLLHRPSPGRMSEELQKEYMEKAMKLGYEDLPIESGAPSDPIVLDGHGRILYRFPNLDAVDGSSEAQGIHKALPGDFGLVYSTIIDDINGDGRREWIAYKRHKVWIFEEI